MRISKRIYIYDDSDNDDDEEDDECGEDHEDCEDDDDVSGADHDGFKLSPLSTDALDATICPKLDKYKCSTCTIIRQYSNCTQHQ